MQMRVLSEDNLVLVFAPIAITIQKKINKITIVEAWKNDIEVSYEWS